MNMNTRTQLLALACSGLGPLSANHLFDPVADDQLRELAADRPDATESPQTVDAGRFQLEASLYDYRRHKGEESHTFGSLTAKVGLTDSSDLQFVWDSYSRTDSGAEGSGDLTIRYKHNLWGNEGGGTAFALFPFVKIPTGGELSNDQWEGGLILPFSTSLAQGVGLGLMAEIDYLYEEEEGNHAFAFVHTAVLGFDLSERLGLFTEYIGTAGEGFYEASLAAGLTYQVHEHLLLDAGATFGLTDEAEDLGLFTGFTIRY
ncbi:transporter [Roseibacillus ishigakijimensis]|uniref:Transporter n=1 Tax=Roseibacillus ishigakijimensis TaxID=454146 RepID=A0A934RLB1_9BACT|nr:transporter [Roseibacillus ishigakijimensis]MBK1832943.1 transporter [Roseibacillus ishigakijimensis]